MTFDLKPYEKTSFQEYLDTKDDYGPLLFDCIMGTNDSTNLSTEQIEKRSKDYMLKYGITQNMIEKLEVVLCQ